MMSETPTITLATEKPRYRVRGPYKKTVGRLGLMIAIELWYDQKAALGSAKMLAARLNVSPSVVEHMIQQLRISRQKAR